MNHWTSTHRCPKALFTSNIHGFFLPQRHSDRPGNAWLCSSCRAECCGLWSPWHRGSRKSRRADSPDGLGTGERFAMSHHLSMGIQPPKGNLPGFINVIKQLSSLGVTFGTIFQGAMVWPQRKVSLCLFKYHLFFLLLNPSIRKTYEIYPSLFVVGNFTVNLISTDPL